VKARRAALWLALAAVAARGENLAPASGIYGATLGAGAATGAERSAFGQNPASLRPGSAGIRADYHRPYGLGDLQVGEAGVFRDGKRGGLACDWRVTSITELYSEQGYRLAPSWRLLRKDGFPGDLDLGYGLTAWRTAEAGSEAAWDLAHEAGLAWRPWPRLKAGLFAAGLPWRPYGAAPGRIVQFGLEADSRGPAAPGAPFAAGQILRLDFRRAGKGPWRALASLSARPHPAWEAGFGLATHPFQAALGVSLAWRGFRVRQAARYHRYLGRTWLTGADFTR
jgi:hypothetical protein